MFLYDKNLKQLQSMDFDYFQEIDTKDELKSLVSSIDVLLKGSNFIISENLIDNKDVHFLFSIGKTIAVKDVTNLEKNLLNPIISAIETNVSIDNSDPEYKIVNDTFYFNVDKYCYYSRCNDYKKVIYENIKKVWGHFKSYHIFNLKKEMTNDEIKDIYNYLSSNIGDIIRCRPANDDELEYSYTRDVKFIPNSNHFYSSNITQPLHTDYAYFTYEKAPDYLTLFCFQKSEYGGITSLIPTNKLIKIMKTHKPDLYEKVKNVDFTYKSQEDIVHNKKFYDEETDYMNWNYFQIKPEFNSDEQLNLKEEIFKFFNDVITSGQMCDVNVSWQRGDCILFNDHLNLHTRSAFLGERWLSGNSFYYK